MLGRVSAPFGVQGWVKVQSYTEPPEGIAGYGTWELALGAELRPMAVLEWKRAGRGVAVRLAGVDTVEAARSLAGAEVRVERAALPSTRPGEYYWHDLLGLAGVTPAGESLGRVSEVLDLPAHPVLVLSGERERLVPLVPDRVVDVDMEAGRITLDWHPDD